MHYKPIIVMGSNPYSKHIAKELVHEHQLLKHIKDLSWHDKHKQHNWLQWYVMEYLCNDELSVISEPSAATSTSEVEPQLEPLSEELDAELIEIFLEEAQDLIQHSAELLHKWEEQSDDFEVLGELQRDLHTLKGGARMAELSAIGDLSHELETLFEKSVDAKNVVAPSVISSRIVLAAASRPRFRAIGAAPAATFFIPS